ncbi:UNVERIFIED_CONTAM: hypothetical protein FKN15_039190 [Acipenser sinensis]
MNPNPSMSIDNLFPALLECFGIILCGYIAGRANIITSSQAKGLGNFVSKFALPALLFKNMVLLDFANVVWSFLWSILIAKVAVFIIVCVLTLLVASPESRFSKAGLYSIFATQSNDFALGYPIVEALYKDTYPDYLQYIYLVAPVSLMILNPIGFVFCEIQKWKVNKTPQHNKVKIVGVVLLQVLKNPIVFMVIIGIASHFILGQKIPAVMEQFLDGLANSFGGSALFYLGLTMVGQLRKLTKSTFVALILLITAKLLVMPLICREMVELLDGNSSLVNHTSLSNYAFLYGVFPTAPSVAIYASQYNMELEVGESYNQSSQIRILVVRGRRSSLGIPWGHRIGFGVPGVGDVGSSLDCFSSPLCGYPYRPGAELVMPLICREMVELLDRNSSLVNRTSLSNYAFLYGVFPTAPSVAIYESQYNMELEVFLTCLGMILWNFIIRQNNLIGQVLTFIILYSSLYSTYLWTGLIALSLLLLKKDDEPKLRADIFIIAGWGIPAFVVGILLMAGQKVVDPFDSAFFYGECQIISTSVVLSCSILVAGVSLMGLGRSRRDANYQLLDPTSFSGTSEDLKPQNNRENQTMSDLPSPDAEVISNRDCCACESVNREMSCSVQPMPDMIVDAHMNETAAVQTAECVSNCESQICILSQEEQLLHTTDRQLARHVLLCLLLIVGLFAGFISFGIFGLDKHLIIVPFKKRLALLWRGKDKVEEPESAVPEEIIMTCRQFVSYHKDQCVKDIVQERRCGIKTTAGIFCGSDLVDWLIRVGLAHDRGEAVEYGEQLLQGGVLQHLTEEYEFRDESLYYRFIKQRSRV